MDYTTLIHVVLSGWEICGLVLQNPHPHGKVPKVAIMITEGGHFRSRALEKQCQDARDKDHIAIYGVSRYSFIKVWHSHTTCMFVRVVHCSDIWGFFVWLRLFYILAKSNVISGQIPTHDSAHSWHHNSTVPLGNQAISTMMWYPTQLHYPNTHHLPHV